MREGEGEMLALGLVHVRAIGVRNLALCRLGETIQDLDVFLTMTPNGNEQAEGSISHSFQTQAQSAVLGPVWMQSGSVATNLAASALEVKVWARARAESGSEMRKETLIAQSSMPLDTLSAKASESFGWWPLESVRSGHRDGGGGQEQNCRLTIIQARDLHCKRHGDAQAEILERQRPIQLTV